MSIAERFGLPEAFVVTLLLLATVLTLAPYLRGVTLGSVQIPRFDARRRRALRLIGPLSLVAAIALVIPLPALRQTRLRLVDADVTEAGEIDVVVVNTAIASTVITKIELEVTRDRGIGSRPVLIETAQYRIPIDNLRRGQRRGRMTRHLIPGGATERILIAPHTGRGFQLRLFIWTDDGAVLTADLDLLPSTSRGDHG
ncbi:MAG: hypothetical protein ACJ74H_02090 [Thermoanaerobaculia bacterium]